MNQRKSILDKVKELNNLIPDKWVLLDINVDDNNQIKILSGYISEFHDNNEWRISSPIKNIKYKETDNTKSFFITTETELTYTLKLDNIGTTKLMDHIYSQLMKRYTESQIKKVDDISYIERNFINE